VNVRDSVAARSGLHRTYISILERGKRSPTLDTIAVLARALDSAPQAAVSRSLPTAPEAGQLAVIQEEVGLHRLTEALDLEVYALAALSILGPAFVRLLPEWAARSA